MTYRDYLEKAKKYPGVTVVPNVKLKSGGREFEHHVLERELNPGFPMQTFPIEQLDDQMDQAVVDSYNRTFRLDII